MTQLFAVNSPFTWDGTAGLKWDTVSGGAGGHAPPASSDDVVFDANSGAGTITIGSTSACKSLDSTNFTHTVAGSTALTVSGGGLIWGGGITLTYNAVITFADTSGATKSITSNGKQFLGGVTINGAGGVFQLSDAFSCAAILTVTAGTFDFNSKAATISQVAYNGAGTKSILLGNSPISITGTGNAWNANATGTTQTTGGSSKITFTNTSATGKTFTGQNLSFDDVTFSGPGSGAYTFSFSGTMRDFACSDGTTTGLTISSTCTARNVNFMGFVGTLTQPNQMNVTGSLTMGAGMTDGGVANINLTGSSGTQSVTSNGVHFARSVTVVNPGATASLADAFFCTAGFTLTSGSFTTNGKAMTVASILSSNSNVRTLTLDNSAIALSGIGTPLNLATTTNLTFSAAGSSITLTDASASSKAMSWNALTLGDITLSGTGTGAYTFTCNAGGLRDLFVSNTGGATFTPGGSNIQTRDIDFTGFTGTFANGTNFLIGGSLTCGVAMTWADQQRHTFNATSGTRTITANGVQINGHFEFDGVGGEWHQTDDLIFAGTLVPTFRMVNGTYRTQGHAIQAQEIDGSTGTPGPWVFDFTNSTLTASNNLDPWYFPDLSFGATIISSGSTIIINDGDSSGAYEKRFHGGGATYNNLTLSGTGTNSFRINQGNTFTGTVTDNNPTAHTVFINAGVTQTVKGFSFVGSVGHLISLRSSLPNTAFVLSCPANDVVCDYLDVQDSVATGGARWFAGRHSVNSAGKNNGWRFTDRYRSPVVAA